MFFFNQESYPHLFRTILGGNPKTPAPAQAGQFSLECSHFKPAANPNVDCIYWASDYKDLRYNHIASSTIEEMKAYFSAQYTAGTPVTIYYPLATPIAITPAVAPLTSAPQLDRITPRLNVVATDAQRFADGLR